MEWAKILVPAIATLIGAAVVVYGWHKSHQLTSDRDQMNKRRELRLTMMVDAYRALANSAHRPFTGTWALEVEKALESIQLLGGPAQIDLAQRLVREFAARQEVDWQLLLKELRDSLREELGLEKVGGGILHIRAADDSRRPAPGAPPPAQGTTGADAPAG